MPYFPTPAERDSAVLAGAAQPSAARSGIFGAPIRADAFTSAPEGAALAHGDAPTPAMPQLPQAQIDYEGLARPVDMSNARIKKPGFFEDNGLGERLLKGFGEFALRYSASQGDPYALMVFRNRYEQQQAGVRAQEDARRRQQEREEWMWREDYKRSHPDDQFTQYMQAAGIDPRSSQGQAFYRQRAESMAAPPMMAIDGFDPQGNPTKTFMPRTGIGLGGRAAPAGPAVGTVRNGYRFQGGNPNDRNSWVPVGGASPAGGATFRR